MIEVIEDFPSDFALALMGCSWAGGRRPRSLQPRRNPRARVNHAVSVSLLDQAKHYASVVIRGLEALADKRTTSVVPAAGKPFKGFEAPTEQFGSNVAGRVSARSVSF
ncbi:hypothetical protein [Bradyrhizobium sp. Leo121]|uniref:hypothetical protein n=1 Tax=Bradyrhizobium sp. Leo121 TaxID=1571195 RepID=UPI0010E799FC|nr:hypothetical protein [Bradyrhizobium sp. Leo121]RZN19480.1 hypothetical protein CWO90_35205 [Bradyrhizobium sp. Leo121]